MHTLGIVFPQIKNCCKYSEYFVMKPKFFINHLNIYFKLPVSLTVIIAKFCVIKQNSVAHYTYGAHLQHVCLTLSQPQITAVSTNSHVPLSAQLQEDCFERVNAHNIPCQTKVVMYFIINNPLIFTPVLKCQPSLC